MSAKKSSPKKSVTAEKPATELQPVKIEQGHPQPELVLATDTSPTLPLYNKATGRTVIMSRKSALNLSGKYPEQYQIQP
jgi:hypothetical protein